MSIDLNSRMDRCSIPIDTVSQWSKRVEVTSKSSIGSNSISFNSLIMEYPTVMKKIIYSSRFRIQSKGNRKKIYLNSNVATISTNIYLL